MERFVAILALCLAACSASSPGPDPSPRPDTDAADPGPDLAPDLAADLASDPDGVSPADPDGDEGPDPLPDVPDSPPEFHWASGCEGSGTGASWTRIPDATFPRGPLVQMSDRDGATLVWRTAAPSGDEGCVDATWPGGGSRTGCALADANGQYEVPLYGLPAATEVSYSVRVADAHTGQLSFRTLPDRPVPMRFAVFADAHNNIENLSRMTAVALAEGVDFAIAVGDLTGSGQVEEFDQTFRGFQDLGTRVNVWAVLGNHDEKNIHGYLDAFVLPEGNEFDDPAAGLGEAWWARRIGNVWIGGGWIRDLYFSWPETDLGEVGWFRRQFETEEFTTARWKLFFHHEPPWVASGGGDCDTYGETSVRAVLVPVMASAGIQASFHGHMHGIEWGSVDGVRTYVVGGLCGCGMDTGDCPAPEGLPQPWNTIYGIANLAIVETACDRLTVRFMDLDGNELARDEIPTTPGG
jgi:hypothetical protein